MVCHFFFCSARSNCHDEDEAQKHKQHLHFWWMQHTFLRSNAKQRRKIILSDHFFINPIFLPFFFLLRGRKCDEDSELFLKSISKLYEFRWQSLIFGLFMHHKVNKGTVKFKSFWTLDVWCFLCALKILWK